MAKKIVGSIIFIEMGNIKFKRGNIFRQIKIKDVWFHNTAYMLDQKRQKLKMGKWEL